MLLIGRLFFVIYPHSEYSQCKMSDILNKYKIWHLCQVIFIHFKFT